MSELDKILESDQETGGTQAPQASHSRDPVVNTDLVDTFQLFKTYLDGKMSTLQEDLAVAKKLKKEVAVKLKGDGNQINLVLILISFLILLKYRNVFQQMIQLLLTLFRALFSNLTGEISLLGLRINLPPVGKLCVSMNVMILRQIQRMKKGYVQRKTWHLGALRIKRDHIRIANLFLQLLCLCPVLLLQLQNLHFVESATNSRPFGAAENDRQRRTTYVTTATRWVTGDRNFPFSPPLEPVPQSQESSKINDKYSNSVCFHDDSFLHDQFEMYVQHVKFLDSIDITSISKGV